LDRRAPYGRPGCPANASWAWPGGSEFNPLQYVNTGIETSVEFIVFDALWKLDATGAFVPNLAAGEPGRSSCAAT
jgi:hypothetical protein